MGKKASGARNGAAGISRKKKAELVNVALGRVALGTACRVLRSLANAKEFETAGNPVPFRAHAEKYTQEMLEFSVAWAGKPAANPGFIRRMTRQWLEFAAGQADPDHAAMLDEALILLDRIGNGQRGFTLTQPSPMEGEGSLARAAHAGVTEAAGGGMSDEIVYVLDVDIAKDDPLPMGVVVLGDSLLTSEFAETAHQAMLEAIKNAITVFGVPDVVAMDNSPAAIPSVEYCRRLGIRVRRPHPGMPNNCANDTMSFADGLGRDGAPELETETYQS